MSAPAALATLCDLGDIYTAAAGTGCRATLKTGKTVEQTSSLPRSLVGSPVDGWFVVRVAAGQCVRELFEDAKLRWHEPQAQPLGERTNGEDQDDEDMFTLQGNSTSKKRPRAAEDPEGIECEGGARLSLESFDATRSTNIKPRIFFQPSGDLSASDCPFASSAQEQQSAGENQPKRARLLDGSRRSKAPITGSEYLVFLPSVEEGSAAGSKVLLPQPVKGVIQVAKHLLPWGSVSGSELRTNPYKLNAAGGSISCSTSSSTKGKNHKGGKNGGEGGDQEGDDDDDDEEERNNERPTTTANGSNQQEEGIILDVVLHPPGEGFENVVPLARVLTPITCNGAFLTGTKFKRIDYGLRERQLLGTWDSHPVQYQSRVDKMELQLQLKRSPLTHVVEEVFTGKNASSSSSSSSTNKKSSKKSKITNDKSAPSSSATSSTSTPAQLYVAALVGSRLHVFATELHGLRSSVPAKEETMLSIATNIRSMDAEMKADRLTNFHEQFSAAKRLRKIKNSKNKEVTDSRLEGDLGELQNRLQKAGDEKPAVENPHIQNAKTYMPEWNPTPKNEKDVFQAGLNKAFPASLLKDRLKLGDNNTLVRELWHNRAKATESKLRDACGSVTAFDLIRNRNLSDATRVKTIKDAEGVARVAGLIRILCAMYSIRAFSFSGTREQVKSKFRHFDFEFLRASDESGGKKGKGKKGKDNSSGAGEEIGDAAAAKGDADDKISPHAVQMQERLKEHLIDTFYQITVTSEVIDRDEAAQREETCVLNKKKLLIHLALFVMQNSPSGSLNYASLEHDLGLQDKHALRRTFEYMQCELSTYPSTTVTLPKKFEPRDALTERDYSKKKKTKGGGGKGGGKGKGKKGKKGGGD
ncbi:unnamed protein product [Amoebophrya sp. A25]|nr:unnamed protein product [Amoebophrya sp. A25]|eukprot:GSA25T00022210001.1